MPEIAKQETTPGLRREFAPSRRFAAIRPLSGGIMKICWGSVAFFKRLFLGIFSPRRRHAGRSVRCPRCRLRAAPPRRAETLKAKMGPSPDSWRRRSRPRAAPGKMERADARLKELLEERAQADAARARGGRHRLPNALSDLSCDAEQGEAEPENTVFLTFDDGPSGRTAEILDILKRYGVKATFFIIGKNADTRRGRGAPPPHRGRGAYAGVHATPHVYREIYASVEAYLDDFNRGRTTRFWKYGHRAVGVPLSGQRHQFLQPRDL